MDNVVAYLRVSADAHIEEDDLSISSQRELISMFCKKHNFDIVDWLIDDGVSGDSLRRTQLDKLLCGKYDSTQVSRVVIATPDRLSPDINIFFSLKSLLRKSNLDIVCVVENWSEQDKHTATVLESFLAVAETVERESIRNRTMSGRRQKAKTGGYCGGQAPMGYRVELGKLVINPAEVDVVRFIIRRKRAGESMTGTVAALNEAGYKTRNGKAFVISTVQSIWKNERTYLGEYRYGPDGVWVKGEHEPIITDDE